MINLIPEQESLTVEFKSDRKRLPDSDLHKLTENGTLRKIGERKDTVYERGPLL